MFHDFEEVLGMSRLSPQPAGAGRAPWLRGRTKLAVALTAALLPLGAAPFLVGSSPTNAGSGLAAADAATTCVLPQVVAGQQPNIVPPCTTIVGSIPPTTQPTGPQPWTAFVVMDDTNLAGTVTADRSYFTVDPTTKVQTVTPAGSTDLNLRSGTGLLLGPMSFPPLDQAGRNFFLRLHEAGSAGSLCRVAVNGVAPSNGTLKSLVSTPITESAADLNSAVQSLVFPLPIEVGFLMNTQSASLVPDGPNLKITTSGKFTITDPNRANTVYHFNFNYNLDMAITPATDADVTHIIAISPANTGQLTFTWDQATLPPNAAQTLFFLQTAVQNELHGKMPILADSVANHGIDQRHDVNWFTGQGFALSIQSVSVTPAGVSVVPSVCRLDPGPTS